MSLFFRVFSRLLPDALPWRIVVEKQLRKFFEGLSETPEDVKEFADEVLLDAFPEGTRQLSEWERQFGLRQGTSDEARRQAIDTAWKSTGGQSPKYIQDLLQAAGFDLYVHEWWASGPDPYVARDPRDYTTQPITGSFQCFDGPGAPECFDGPGAPYCNDFLANDPGYLVNLDLTKRAPPPVPADSSKWPYFLYLGAETFPNRAEVPDWRRSELEALVLKLKPAQQWVVMLVDYWHEEPTGYDLFAWFDTSLGDGTATEPGLDADFVVSTPSLGFITSPWEQDTPSLQPFLDSATGAVYFREGRHLVSAGTAGNWAWLHDLTSSGKFAVEVRTGASLTASTVLGTFDGTDGDIGFRLVIHSDGVLRIQVGRATTTENAVSSAGVIQPNTTHRIVVDKSANTYRVLVDGVIATAGTFPSLSSDPPESTLVLGARVDGASPFTGWVREALFFRGSSLPTDSWLLEYLQNGPDMSGLVPPMALELIWSVDRSDTTFESGSARRIQTVQNPGALGGTRVQSTATERPYATRFPSGLVDYFPGSGSVVSSLDPSVFTGLHDDSAENTLAFRFRIDDLSSNQRILRTMTASNANSGVILQVQSDGRVRVFVGNGSGSTYAIDTFSGAGQVQEGGDHTIVFVKTPSSMALYLDDMATPLLSGPLGSPSSGAPSETLTMGQAGNRIHGWISEVILLGVAANQTQRETVAARLSRHDFGPSVTELITSYEADGLAHAYTPESLQVSGSDVTAWNDVVGEQPLAVTDGDLVSLDGLDAVELGAFSGLSNNAGVAAIASGTDKAFAVVDYGQWVTGGYRLWLFGGDAGHYWSISGSSHEVTREDDGFANIDGSTPIGATTAQRFFAHSFHSANGPNLVQVDGTIDAPALDINPTTVTDFSTGASGPGATIRLAYRLLFDRALNVGELSQLREAFLREVA